MSGYRPGYNSTQRTRMASGLCITCEAPAPGRTQCKPCLEKVAVKTRERTAARLAAGLCGACGLPAEGAGYTSCGACRKINGHERARRSKTRLAAGLCPTCGEPKLPHSVKCERHYLEASTVTAGLKSTDWQLLKDILVRQEYRCHYTGEPLALGNYVEIDHLKPKSRFPHLYSEPSNLAFTTCKINVRKGILTDDEFIALCVAVAKHRGGLK